MTDDDIFMKRGQGKPRGQVEPETVPYTEPGLREGEYSPPVRAVRANTFADLVSVRAPADAPHNTPRTGREPQDLADYMASDRAPETATEQYMRLRDRDEGYSRGTSMLPDVPSITVDAEGAPVELSADPALLREAMGFASGDIARHMMRLHPEWFAGSGDPRDDADD